MMPSFVFELSFDTPSAGFPASLFDVQSKFTAFRAVIELLGILFPCPHFGEKFSDLIQ